jgi:hypothetical protein
MKVFQNNRPIPGKPIERYFTRPLSYPTQIEDTPNAIPDEVFQTKIYTSLPDHIITTIQIAQYTKHPLQDIFDCFQQNESTRAVKEAASGTTTSVGMSSGLPGCHPGLELDRGPGLGETVPRNQTK